MADQLWIVFLDGVAQKGILPFAGSEVKALRMWQEQSGHLDGTGGRVHAIPKNDTSADAKFAEENLARSGRTKHLLSAEPDDDTTGYHCWVVNSKKPHEARTWKATRRADAVSQVKTAVKNLKSEGGVECRDPRKPFEVTFAIVRGKLVTTMHTD